MTDRPILFSTPMVKALLSGQKTQTRRVLKDAVTHVADLKEEGFPIHSPSVSSGHTDKGELVWALSHDGFFAGIDHFQIKPRFAVGDRLWVREAWRTECNYDDTPPRDLAFDEVQWRYEADGEWSDRDPMTAAPGKLRPGIHMPRWASRLTLTVTDVRVQRLQDISEEDSIAEGIERVEYTGTDEAYKGMFGWKDYRDHPHACVPFIDPQNSYETLWDSINETRYDGIYAWSANPFVVAVSFDVVKRNIDEIANG